MKYSYELRNVCPSMVEFELDKDIVKNVHFTRGCNGNLKAIGTLIEGMPADQVIEKLSGITCDKKHTSCSDQFAKVLQDTIKNKEKNIAIELGKGE